jgi:hypothetical protein
MERAVVIKKVRRQNQPQWLILPHNTATGAAGLTLQSPFSGFKDRQVTHKEVLRKQVGCRIEGKWSQKRKVVGKIPAP